jgi:hypothetical protein
MNVGFAYVAYPSKYGGTGIKTFMINQDGVVFEKDLGKIPPVWQRLWPDSIPTTTGSR